MPRWRGSGILGRCHAVAGILAVQKLDGNARKWAARRFRGGRCPAMTDVTRPSLIGVTSARVRMKQDDLSQASSSGRALSNPDRAQYRANQVKRPPQFQRVGFVRQLTGYAGGFVRGHRLFGCPLFGCRIYRPRLGQLPTRIASSILPC